MNDIRDARTFMVQWRKANGKSVQELARLLEIGQNLLERIETGGYTHPKIAERIGKLYGLSEEEVKQLVNPNSVQPLVKDGKRPWNVFGWAKNRDDQKYHEYNMYKDQRYRRCDKA